MQSWPPKFVSRILCCVALVCNSYIFFQNIPLREIFWCKILIIIIIISFFTLGSIYSTYACGDEQITETNNSNQTEQG